MIMEKYEIVIVGAGPSGLRAARTLAEAKKHVLVLEKNSVIGKKVCAGGLTVKDTRLLPASIIDRTFGSIVLHTAKGAHEVDLGSHPVSTVNREKLGQWMAEEAEKAGAEIRTACRVDRIEGSSVFVNGREIGFDYLVGADGSSSAVRKSLRMPVKKKLSGLHYMSKTPRNDLEVFLNDFRQCLRYSWIFPHKDAASVGTGAWACNAHELKQSLDALCSRLCIEKTGFEAFSINFDYRGSVFGNRYLAGDAAGFASGLTGEGIYPAILSGEEAARGILDKDYGYPGIKQLLKIKSRHESLLRILSMNRCMPEIVFNDMVPLLLKRRDWCRTINNICDLV